MSKRPTPETDAFSVEFKTVCGSKKWVPVDLSRRLERERDEAREALQYIAHSGWPARYLEDFAREFLKKKDAGK